MIDFINKFFRKEETSKTQAKERLRLVLMSDRVSLAPDVFDSMKGEMLSVVRRYLDIDERGLDVHFENAERQFMLLANIPVLKVKPFTAEPAQAAAANGGHQNGALLLDGSAAQPRTRRRRRRRKHPAQDQAQQQPPADEPPTDEPPTP
ncbi:MAG TPA: cell division topological specificity factor MinE [Candidatus Eremiobacteraceae bacterium]|jgi:cell division topological specificity factor|nr:cell division topological specificity factor MinE [Candidatus Eremiobacteraceae bacterium]